MKVVLETEVDVCRFTAFAEVAWLESRPELGLLCRAALDDGQQVTLETVEGLLPGITSPGALNIVRWLGHIGLTDVAGALTGLGQLAARTNEAPVPEQGVYEFWMLDHPLARSRVLHVRRVVSAKDGRFEGSGPVPMRPARDVAFTSVVEPDKRVTVREFPSNHRDSVCVLGPAGERVGLGWRWQMTEGASEWRLTGSLDSRDLVFGEPEPAVADVRRLFATVAEESLADAGRWNTSTGRLEIGFDSLESREVESFLRTCSRTDVEVPGFGRFETMRIDDLPLGPVGRSDAQKWAMARLSGRLADSQRYRTREDVRHLWVDAVEDSPLAEHGPTLPAHDAMLRNVRDLADTAEAFWFLAAPVDLSPTETPEEALAEMQVASNPTPRVAEERRFGFRIPHGAGWSMVQLLTRLVESQTRRIILCDRYVRGAQNIEMLEVLSRAVGQVVAGAQLEVVTERATEAGDNFKAIEELLGKSPRHYADVFGPRRVEQPHDRYLLVDAAGGRFAWQLSNSPLDARPANGERPEPGSPLRWRDLTANRVSLGELSPALASIFNGVS